jgi:hypothetical protein
MSGSLKYFGRFLQRRPGGDGLANCSQYLGTLRSGERQTWGPHHLGTVAALLLGELDVLDELWMSVEVQ